MVIHVVQKDETITSIADKYGVSAERLILENGIRYPDRLVEGETIVILIPEVTYTVREGDTLEGIADSLGVNVMQLLRNNPYLSDREYIYPGETIVISYEDYKTGDMSINGYVYPYIDIGVLRKTLPFLTYMTVFTYTVTAEGNIDDIDDEEIIRTAKAYGVAPVMMLVAQSHSMQEEIDVLHTIYTREDIQERFFDNLLNILQTKGYSGVTINTPYILPADRSIYEQFVVLFANRVRNAGYLVFDTFSIRVFELLTGTLFTGLEYSEFSREVDGITFITFAFGYSEGIPPGTLSMDTLRRFLENTISQIPPEKSDIGIIVIGYVWALPYIPGISKGMAINYDSAIDIAVTNSAQIRFDETTNVAYFQYTSVNEYVVRFWDARSIYNFARLVPEYGLNGMGIWNIMSWFPQMWLVINSQYNIKKIL